MDAHLAVANEHMAATREQLADMRADRAAESERSQALAADMREEIGLNRDEIRLSREEIRLSREEIRLSREDRIAGREFMRQLTDRHERATREMVDEISANTTVLHDLHDEHVAFRESLMRVHDRLEDLRHDDGR